MHPCMNRQVKHALTVVVLLCTSLSADRLFGQKSASMSFDDVVSFVDRSSHLIVLSDDSSGASIAVWPDKQGRVLTSSDSPKGRSYGWVNQELIASGKVQQHFNAYGGEDRLWIGPEGGQFSVFFAALTPFDLDHWYTPAPVDTEPFEVVSQSKTSVSLRSEFTLTNYSGTRFHVRVDREVRLLPAEEVWSDLRIAKMTGVKLVGFESENRLTNLAASGWSKSTGLLSLWILGQFNASPSARIILPIRAGSNTELGIPVITDYFGTVPADRIAVKPSFVIFKADAQYRSKLGLSPQRAKGTLGSYDPQNHLLTIVQYSQPEHEIDYVNSAWKIQQDPFKGDVANCYNDGPPAPGKPQMGNFYEMESSSPAKALASQASVEHVHRTIHVVGTEKQLDAIARAALGVSLDHVQLSQPYLPSHFTRILQGLFHRFRINSLSSTILPARPLRLQDR